MVTAENAHGNAAAIDPSYYSPKIADCAIMNTGAIHNRPAGSALAIRLCGGLNLTLEVSRRGVGDAAEIEATRCD